jgi:hypothetical protein
VRRDREIAAASSLLGHPLVAATLGIMLGVLLMFISLRASTFVTPDNPMRGFSIVIIMTGARFFLALVALAAYYIFAPDGLAPFGFALALSFVAGLGVEAVRVSSPKTSHTSA